MQYFHLWFLLKYWNTSFHRSSIIVIVVPRSSDPQTPPETWTLWNARARFISEVQGAAGTPSTQQHSGGQRKAPSHAWEPLLKPGYIIEGCGVTVDWLGSPLVLPDRTRLFLIGSDPGDFLIWWTLASCSFGFPVRLLLWEVRPTSPNGGSFSKHSYSGPSVMMVTKI